MGFIQTAIDAVIKWFSPVGLDRDRRERLDRIDRVRDYYYGDQRTQLKTKTGQPDYNVLINVVGPVVDRSIALLVGKGVTFDLPGEDRTPADDYLDEVWKLSKKSILLHKAAMVGASTGTAAIQIIPDGAYSPRLNKNIPRLVCQDSAFLEIQTEADDVDQHTKYTISYVVQIDGKDTGKKREIIRLVTPGEVARIITWQIVDYLEVSGKWIEQSRIDWPYSFPPLVVWQNLPLIGTAEGMPDVTPDIIRLQDKVNFIASNINKIIAIHASPRTVAKNLQSEPEQLTASVEQMWKISGDNSDLFNLEMQSDLSASINYLGILSRSIFDATHTVDLASMADKLGAITNFGLRVLFQDALQKLGIKRELYGDALRDINYALLVLGGFGDNADPGEVVWPDPLPVNEAEVQGVLLKDLSAEIVSKQTVAEKRGYDWENEQELMEGEKASQSNIGEQLIRNFNRGQV